MCDANIVTKTKQFIHSSKNVHIKWKVVTLPHTMRILLQKRNIDTKPNTPPC